MARRRKWVTSGALASLLGVTRNIGSGIMLPLCLEFIRHRPTKASPKFREILSLLGLIALSSAGILLWCFWLKNHTGSWIPFVSRQSDWQREPMYPWNTVWAGIKQAKTFALGYPGGVYVIEAASVGALLTLGAMGVRRISLPLWSWIWICILPSLLAPFPGRMLMSSVRFTAVIFPAFLILATYVKRPSLDQGIRYVFAGTYAIAVAMYVCGHYMF